MPHYILWLWKCRFLLRATSQKLPPASSAQYSPLVQQTVRLRGRDDSLVVSLTMGCDTQTNQSDGSLCGIAKREAPIKQIDALENARGTLKHCEFNDIMRPVACTSY